MSDGFYLMRNGQSHGWFADNTQTDRHAAISNMRGGAPTRVVAEKDLRK